MKRVVITGIGIVSCIGNDAETVTNNLKNSDTTTENILDTLPFNTEHTYLTNPAINIKGMSKNRWLELHLNPQNNSIEPFDRNGKNSVLNNLDTFDKCY